MTCPETYENIYRLDQLQRIISCNGYGSETHNVEVLVDYYHELGSNCEIPMSKSIIVFTPITDDDSQSTGWENLYERFNEVVREVLNDGQNHPINTAW